MKSATIVGAGLVGSLWSVYLAKAGYKVTILEMRSDLRKADISAGKSINLALSVRGWTALESAGVADEVKDIAIPMYGRTMHDEAGNLTYQPYGQDGQAIFSVSRAGVNCRMMEIAEKYGQAEILFEKQCLDVDFENAIVYYKDVSTGEEGHLKSDVVFAADGAFSAIRYKGMQKQRGFNFSQRFIEDGYREILLPANADGSYKLEKNRLHIWPRGRFMMIALPNEDGSFTCTLFMPGSNHEYAFDKLKSKDDVNHFFKEVFPDFYEMMPEIGDSWEDHPLSGMVIIRCFPWSYGKVSLIGDSAHATVPFYGQGMNSGFEDCRIMNELMIKHNEDWEKVFKEFETVRKPDGDGLQDLSLHNYYVMRDYVADPDFLLQKKFELRISKLYPNKYLPLYSQVSFSNIRYSEAYSKGMEQDAFIKEIMAEHDIQKLFDEDKVDDLIHEIFAERPVYDLATN